MMTGHMNTPWEADGKLDIHDCDGQHMARISGLRTSRKSDTERRDRIILAVNAHDDLVAACEMAGRGLAAILGDKTHWDKETGLELRGILRAALAKAGKEAT